MTSFTSYKITDVNSKQSFIVNSPIYENVELMTIGLENRFSVYPKSKTINRSVQVSMFTFGCSF